MRKIFTPDLDYFAGNGKFLLKQASLEFRHSSVMRIIHKNTLKSLA